MGVANFDQGTGRQMKVKLSAPYLTSIFTNDLINAATNDWMVVEIMVTMTVKTGMDTFGHIVLKRNYSVRIVEQHAMTMTSIMECKSLILL